MSFKFHSSFSKCTDERLITWLNCSEPREYSGLMRILAKAASIIAIATASAVFLSVIANGASAVCVTPQQAETVSGYEPPDDIGGPGSSQGSGTR
jgi:hypothetical protein